MADFGIVPIVIALGGQTAVVAVTDTAGNEKTVFLQATSGTKVSQPYTAIGVQQVTLYRVLQAASETLLVTVLVGGEPAARQLVTLVGPTTGATVTAASALVSVAGAPAAEIGAIDCGSSS